MPNTLIQKDGVSVPTDIHAIETEVKQLTITTPESYQAASDLMIRIRKTRKAEEDNLKAKLKPYREKIKAFQDHANIGLILLQNCEAQLQRGLLEYQRQAREEAEKQQKKALEKFEKKVEKAEAKAEATGTPLPLIMPPPIIQPPPTQVKTESGALHTTKIKKWRIGTLTSDQLTGIKRDDPLVKQIPDCFFGLLATEISKLVRAIGEPGKPVPGCPGIDVYEEEVISVR